VFKVTYMGSVLVQMINRGFISFYSGEGYLTSGIVEYRVIIELRYFHEVVFIGIPTRFIVIDL